MLGVNEMLLAVLDQHFEPLYRSQCEDRARKINSTMEMACPNWPLHKHAKRQRLQWFYGLQDTDAWDFVYWPEDDPWDDMYT